MKIQEIKYADILLRNEQNYPYKLALFSEGQSYDYKELNKITDVYASKLIEMGIKKGDHVIL